MKRKVFFLLLVLKRKSFKAIRDFGICLVQFEEAEKTQSRLLSIFWLGNLRTKCSVSLMLRDESRSAQWNLPALQDFIASNIS